MKKLFTFSLMLAVFLLSGCDSDSGAGTSINTQKDTKVRNKAPLFVSTAPLVAQVDIAYRYDVIVVDGENEDADLIVNVNLNDTCGGTATAKKLGQSTFLYTFTPGAAQVNTQCIVGLTASDGKKETEQNTAVDIGEDNSAPYFTSTAPTAATEDVLYTYNIIVADDNVPAQTLALTTGLIDICGGALVDNGDGTGAYTFTPNENEGGIPCLLSLTVTDSAGTSFDQNSIVDITEDNKAPLNNAPPNASGDELTLIRFDINPTDPDVPAQLLTCSIVTNNCPGGALNGCTFEWTPTEAQGPNAGCTVTTRASDGTLTNDATTTVTVTETNEVPTWTAGPTSIIINTGLAYNTTNGSATDPDLPTQNLDCSNNGDTCSFAVAVTGSASGPVNCNVSFTAAMLPETCNVDVQVSDGAGGVITSNITIYVQQSELCVLYVNDDVIGGAGNGSSWSDAFTVLQDAVDTATAGCEVWVAEGTYTNIPASTASVLTMKDDVKIFGGFFGDEISLGDRQSPTDYPTILDGEYQSYHTVTGSSNARLDGFTVTGGNARDALPLNCGGGMYNDTASNLFITNCVFSGNSADPTNGLGGGMYNTSSSPTLTNCTFSTNSARFGAGVFNMSSSPTLTNCTFSANSATSGAGMYNSDSPAILTNCTFNANIAVDGGGMYNAGNSPILSNCTFSGNLAVGNSGGGMYNSSSTPILSNCTFSGNSAIASDGGGMSNSTSTPTLTNCTFNRNSAISGGGMNNSSSSPPLTNCTFSGNSAIYGGGMYNYSSSPTVTNCTFSENTAEIGGGMQNANSSPTVTNCIMWNNTATSALGEPEIHNNLPIPEPVATVTYSDIQGGCAVTGSDCGAGNIDADPIFLTGPYGIYYLTQLPANLCIDGGSNTAANLGLDNMATDYLGSPDTGQADMGRHYPIP